MPADHGKIERHATIHDEPLAWRRYYGGGNAVIVCICTGQPGTPFGERGLLAFCRCCACSNTSRRGEEAHSDHVRLSGWAFWSARTFEDRHRGLPPFARKRAEQIAMDSSSPLRVTGGEA